jgi:hypothetical protein
MVLHNNASPKTLHFQLITNQDFFRGQGAPVLSLLQFKHDPALKKKDFHMYSKRCLFPLKSCTVPVSTSQYIRQLFSACGFCKTACRGGCELAKPGTGAADRRCMSATRATPRRAYPNVLRPPPLPRSHPAAPPNRAYKLHNTRTASHHTGPPRGEKRHGVVVVASGARIIDEGAGGGGRQRR